MAEHRTIEQRSTPGPWVQFADKGQTVAIMPAMRDGDVCSFSEPYPSRADARLMAAAPDMKAILDELEESFERQIYPDQERHDYEIDPPDDREYTVNLTFKQLVALNRAVSKAECP